MQTAPAVGMRCIVPERGMVMAAGPRLHHLLLNLLSVHLIYPMLEEEVRKQLSVTLYTPCWKRRWGNSFLSPYTPHAGRGGEETHFCHLIYPMLEEEVMKQLSVTLYTPGWKRRWGNSFLLPLPYRIYISDIISEQCSHSLLFTQGIISQRKI